MHLPIWNLENVILAFATATMVAFYFYDKIVAWLWIISLIVAPGYFIGRIKCLPKVQSRRIGLLITDINGRPAEQEGDEILLVAKAIGARLISVETIQGNDLDYCLVMSVYRLPPGQEGSELVQYTSICHARVIRLDGFVVSCTNVTLSTPITHPLEYIPMIAALFERTRVAFQTGPRIQLKFLLDRIVAFERLKPNDYWLHNPCKPN